MKKLSFISDSISHRYITASQAPEGPKSRRRWFRDTEYKKKKDAAMEIDMDVRVMQSQSKEPVTEDHC